SGIPRLPMFTLSYVGQSSGRRQAAKPCLDVGVPQRSNTRLASQRASTVASQRVSSSGVSKKVDPIFPQIPPTPVGGFVHARTTRATGDFRVIPKLGFARFRARPKYSTDRLPAHNKVLTRNSL